MRKILIYLWLPLVSLAVLALIYGGLTIFDLKNQNQSLSQKQKEFEKQISLLENKFEELAASTKQENQQPGAPKKIAGLSTKATPTLIPTSTPSTTLGASPTPTPRLTPTPTPTPTPAPISTPTPTPTPVSQASVEIENVGTYAVHLEIGDTAFSILLRAGQENSFNVEYQTYEELGAFVTCIAGICSHDYYYWAFYYNGNYSRTGASSQPVSSGDETAWKFESF